MYQHCRRYHKIVTFLTKTTKIETAQKKTNQLFSFLNQRVFFFAPHKHMYYIYIYYKFLVCFLLSRPSSSTSSIHSFASIWQEHNYLVWLRWTLQKI